MFVEAAPVAVTATAPLVVSAETAIAQDDGLANVVNAELINVVVAAVPSRRAIPSIFHDDVDVPPDACWRAVIRIENVYAELFGRLI